MDKGAQLYRELIDTLVEMSHKSVGEQWATQKYEGIGNDFIGRRSGDWEWSE